MGAWTRGIRTGVAAVIVAVGLLAVPTAPAGAAVPWNRGAVVVPQGTSADHPQIAVNARGDRFVVYADQERDIWLVELNTFGDLQPRTLLYADPDKRAGYPRIVVDDQDRITVAWYVVDPALGDRTHVAARTVAADGSLGELQVLSDLDDNAYYPEVAVDSAGVATVVWENQLGGGNPGRIEGVRLAAGTGAPLGAPMTLDDPSAGADDAVGVADLTVAMDPQDRAVVAWVRFDGDADGNFRQATVRALRLSAEGTPGEVQPVSDDPSVSSRYPAVAVAPDGTATIAYTTFGDVAATMVTRLSPVDATPGTPVRVSSPERPTSDDPAVTVDDQSRVTVGWTSFKGSSIQVETRRIGADGQLEAPRAPLGRVATFGRREMLALSSDDRGRVVVAWPGADGSGGRDSRMHAVRLTAGAGAPSTTHRLSAPGGWGSIGEVIDIVTDSRGRTSAVWSSNGQAAVRRAAPARYGLVSAQSTILAGPRQGQTTDDPTPTFRFEASTVQAVLECRVDGQPWTSCTSPTTVGPLDDGRHVFEVRAKDPDRTGWESLTAVARFRVV
jgi:hypothetical protein